MRHALCVLVSGRRKQAVSVTLASQAVRAPWPQVCARMHAAARTNPLTESKLRPHATQVTHRPGGFPARARLQHGLQDGRVRLHDRPQRLELRVGAQEVERPGRPAAARRAGRLHQAGRCHFTRE